MLSIYCSVLLTHFSQYQKLSRHWQMSIFLNSFSDHTVSDLEVQGAGFSCISLGKKTCCLVLNINTNSDHKSPESLLTGPFKEEKTHLRTFWHLLFIYLFIREAVLKKEESAANLVAWSCFITSVLLLLWLKSEYGILWTVSAASLTTIKVIRISLLAKNNNAFGGNILIIFNILCLDTINEFLHILQLLSSSSFKVWLHLIMFFLSRCGVDLRHATLMPKVAAGVLQARAASHSGRATALWSLAPASGSAGAPTLPRLLPSATPAPVTRTTAAPTSPSPSTRRPCLKWVTLAPGRDRLN